MRAFDPEDLVERCRAAVRERDAPGAVSNVVEAVIRRHGSTIDDVLGRTASFEPTTLYSSPELTVQRIAWPGGTASPPHEHRMWAVVGVYAGREVNRVFDRAGSTISAVRTVDVDAGDVFHLPADAIHEVRNPDLQWTAGVHVYGGDILRVERSSWLPDGTEAPQKEVSAQRRLMVEAMRDLASDLGWRISDEARHVAFTALWREVDRLRRNLTTEEARNVVAVAWDVTP